MDAAAAVLDYVRQLVTADVRVVAVIVVAAVVVLDVVIHVLAPRLQLHQVAQQETRVKTALVKKILDHPVHVPAIVLAIAIVDVVVVVSVTAPVVVMADARKFVQQHVKDSVILVVC